MAGNSNFDTLFSYFELCGKLKHLPRTGWVLKGVPQPESVASHMYRMSMMSLLFSNANDVNRDKCLRMCLAHDLAESIVGDITPSDGISKEEKFIKEKAMVKIECTIKGYRNRTKVHVLSHKDRHQDPHLTSLGLIIVSLLDSLSINLSDISQHSSVAFLYVAPILTYNQVPYLIQIVHVLITEAMEHISTLLPQQVGQELIALWMEYEEGVTGEAVLVKDLDRFDMILQAWEYEKEHGKQLQEFFDSTNGKFQTDIVKKWVEHLQTNRNK